MGQEEKDFSEEKEGEEKEEEKKRALPFNFSLDSLLKEILRFVIFLLVAFVIIYFVQGGRDSSFSLDEIRNIDNQNLESISSNEPTIDWVSDEMLVNTADEFANHFIRAVIVISYESENNDLGLLISKNQNLFYAEARKIIGKRKYLELKNPAQQEIIIEEIKTAIQRTVQVPGIKKVFFRDFTIH